ncbi:hypothetical protein F3K50_06175 [Pseudomonas marginalis]|nr:hypothetical protein F3K50_06175 [Pseudomonas marginalis]
MKYNCETGGGGIYCGEKKLF